jgi:hypothetical protein
MICAEVDTMSDMTYDHEGNGIKKGEDEKE